MRSALFTTLVLGCKDALPLDDAKLRYIRSLPSPQWDSVDSRHFRLYAERGRYPASHIMALRDRAERARKDDLALLGMHWYPHRMYVFYFESKARMDSVFDTPGTGQAYPEAQLVLLVANPDIPIPDDRHEIMHVISITRWGWGFPNQVWKHEGLGNLASAPEWPYTIDQMAAQARRDGDERGPAQLTGDRFRDGDSTAHFRAYMLASSFVSYIGVDRLHQLWQRGLQPDEMAALTSRWNDHLRTVSLPERGIDLIHVMECECH